MRNDIDDPLIIKENQETNPSDPLISSNKEKDGTSLLITNPENNNNKEKDNNENRLSISNDELNSSFLDNKYKNDLEVLLSMGYDAKMVKKVFVFLKPNDINETIDYLSEQNGIYQHDFLKKHNQENACFICGAPPNKHINYVSENPKRTSLLENIRDSLGKIRGSRTNNNDINFQKEIANFDKDSNDVKINLNNNNKKKSFVFCMLCDDEIPEDEEFDNSIPCNHIFCSDCYLNYLDDKIKNNKVGNITCMQNKCQVVLKEDFIISHLKGDERLIEKYKKFKKRNELLDDPNVKFCPVPDCESYAKKEGNNKYVQCLEGHKFCFECSKPWHGKKKCEDEIDKDFKKWKKNKVIKRCPKCKMWTEKNHGCNHMTCAECKYQWCWLCGRKYINGHFESGGGCAGLQFAEESWVNNCFILYLYKISLFILRFLLMIIGSLPAISFVIFNKLFDYDENCLVDVLGYVGWFFWMIPYYIFFTGISCVITFFTLLYWPLQEHILVFWNGI